MSPYRQQDMPTGPESRFGGSGAGRFEQGKASQRGGELLPAGRGQAHRHISWAQGYGNMLGGNVEETVPAVAEQLLFGLIRHGAVEVRRNCRCI